VWFALCSGASVVFCRAKRHRRFGLRTALLIAFFACADTFSVVAQTFDPIMIQEALVWVGLYTGPLDGELGPGSLNAVQNFQKSINHPATGLLSLDEMNILQSRAAERKAEAGYREVVDPALGAVFGLPSAFVPTRRNATFGSDYVSLDLSTLVELRHYNSNSSIEYVYSNFRAALAGTIIGYTIQRADWFVISGEVRTKKYYFRFFKVNSGYQGLVVIYDKAQSGRMSPALTLLSLNFQPALIPVDPRLSSSPPIISISIDATASSLLFEPIMKNVEASAPTSKGANEAVSSAPLAKVADNKVRSAADESKLLLDSVEQFLKNKSTDRVRFFKYLVDKKQLKGFNSDMPVLRIVFEERVFFDTDKSEIRSEAAAILDQISESLRQRNGQAALFVAGHADARGSEQYNMDLSIRRAESVARSLSSRGVGSALVWQVGFGKSVPLRPNTTEENMAYNRRVEFLLATQPTIIAAWIKNNGPLCEDGTPDCGVQVSSTSFQAVPVGAAKSKPVTIELAVQTPIEIEVHKSLIEVGPPQQ
jgi:outer membrane protein OmpA-like peptidoglycan-associated protein